MTEIGARDLEEALDSERAYREKVEGVWLLAEEEESLRATIRAIEMTAIEVLSAWLLGGMPHVCGAVGQALEGRASRDAARPVLRALIREDRIGALPLLTQGYQPYFAVYAPSDAAEVERQLDALRSAIASRGVIEARELPEPQAPRSLRVWRNLILQHGEFLGIGHLEDSRLVGWKRT